MTEPAILSLVRIPASSAESVIRALCRALRAAGHVKDTFEAAAVARERRSPTGLPFEGGPVALPHAEPEHVLSPALAIATLAGTVKFREMGSPATQLEVGIVVMPAFTAKDQASGGLAHLIERFQDPHLRTTILAAADAEALRAVVGPVFRGASQ